MEKDERGAEAAAELSLHPKDVMGPSDGQLPPSSNAALFVG